ncbi:thioredoxin family protein [Candidatus Woesearchaeota archaeon]|nr:thioredoxin family protein [Candidatus Woesearchaeota archaeon]
MALLKSNQKALQPGTPAPEFSLKNVDGSVVSLEDFRGNPVVVIFMCNHCPYVIPKMDEIAALQRDYAKKGVVIIGINANDPAQYPEDDFIQMQRIAKKKGYLYYLFDETQEVAKAYGAVCTPDPYVFDKNHTLIYHGRINDALTPDAKPTKHDLREVLDAYLTGKLIKEWFKPSMGCSIKWREDL